jgi:hypothetical protein
MKEEKDKPDGGKGNSDGQGNSSVDVTINYQSASKTHAFPRGTKVADVLVWAIGAFKISDSVATELELVIAGTKDELPGSKTIASLVHGGSTLTLDLVRGDIANGSL